MPRFHKRSEQESPLCGTNIAKGGFLFFGIFDRGAMGGRGRGRWPWHAIGLPACVGHGSIQ